MNISGRPFTTIWNAGGKKPAVKIIDQRFLPFRLVLETIRTCEAMCIAIKDMHLRGAPLIGAAAAFGMYLAIAAGPAGTARARADRAADQLIATRPTAVNLAKAVHALQASLTDTPPEELAARSLAFAEQFRLAEIDYCSRIGGFGVEIIKKIAGTKNGQPVNILTHCNAGWLACVDWGTATAPIYFAHDAGVPVHVWVDETRPRNQGGRLTAWELGSHGVPHTVVTDNAGGLLMQKGLVDMVITGSDRTTASGDVCNKIGTYLKALAAFDNHLPFYAALPSTTIDFSLDNGADIPIETRDGDEVRMVEGLARGKLTTVRVIPENSPVRNDGFDVTPARLVTGIITERGIAQASKEGLRALFPDK